MPFLFVDSLADNTTRFVQISCKILELLLLSMGLISTIVVMKEAILPYSCEFVFSNLIGFWSFIKCFLSSPPTIIIAINLMVLLIFASSAFHRRRDAADTQHQEITSILDVDDDLEVALAHIHESPPVVELPPPPPQPPPSAPPIWDDVVEVTPPPQPTSSTSLHRGTSLYDDVGKDTAVATIEKWKDVLIEKEEREEEREAANQENMDEDNTIDATWEAIIGGGKPKPKKKPLKKSETWEAVSRRRRRQQPRRLDSEEVVPTSPKWRELRKAETFNDAVSVTRRGGLVRRDPSMSLEEFNLKVEKFIKNFNDGIRLQRQESIINQKRG